MTDAQLDKLRGRYETKGEIGNLTIVRTEIARRSIVDKTTVEVGDDIPKWVKVADLTDLQLDRLRAHYETKGETDKHTIVCTEMIRRVATQKAKGTKAGTEEERRGTGSTPPSSSAVKMKIDEAVAQAKAEGFDYEKRVARDCRESSRRSPLELRMTKKFLDGITQTSLAKGDFDAAVVFSARAEGIQRALEEKTASRRRATA